MKFATLALVSSVLMISPVLWGRDVPKKSLQFPARETAHLNCSIKMTKSGLWNLRVKALTPRQATLMDYLYSIRDNVNGSMKDCNNWLKAAKKKIMDEQHTQQAEAKNID